MGTYYLVANRDRHEYLDPAEFGGGGIKWTPLHVDRSPTCIGGALVYLLFNRWKGTRVEFVADSDPSDDWSTMQEPGSGWTDISALTLKGLKEVMDDEP